MLPSTWWTAAFVCLTFPVVSVCGQPTGVSWSCHDTVAASSDVDRSPLQLRLPGTRFRTLFGCSRRNGTCSALETLRNALYKSTTTTTTTTIISVMFRPQHITVKRTTVASADVPRGLPLCAEKFWLLHRVVQTLVYLRQGGYVFTCAHLSVCLLTGLLKKY